MILTPSRFIEIGRALFGPRWQGALAKRIGLSEHSVYNYARGIRTIPANIREKLMALLEEHTALLADLKERTPASASARQASKAIAEVVVKSFKGPRPRRLPTRRDLVWVYVACWDKNGPSKVGVSDHLAQRRIALQNGNPFPLYFFSAAGLRNLNQARSVEAEVIKRLSSKRLKGEWLDVPAAVLSEKVLRVIADLTVEFLDYHHSARNFRKDGTADPSAGSVAA